MSNTLYLQHRKYRGVMETYSKEILPSLRNQGSLKVIYKFRSEI